MQYKSRLRILFVLKILKDGSNKEHPISQLTIMRAVNLLGIECDRRAISADISALIKFGYNIVKLKGGGCYFISNEYTQEEIKIIISGIFKLDIDIATKKKLIRKVKRLINIYERN